MGVIGTGDMKMAYSVYCYNGRPSHVANDDIDDVYCMLAVTCLIIGAL